MTEARIKPFVPRWAAKQRPSLIEAQKRQQSLDDLRNILKSRGSIASRGGSRHESLENRVDEDNRSVFLQEKLIGSLSYLKSLRNETQRTFQACNHIEHDNDLKRDDVSLIDIRRGLEQMLIKSLRSSERLIDVECGDKAVPSFEFDSVKQCLALMRSLFRGQGERSKGLDLGFRVLLKLFDTQLTAMNSRLNWLESEYTKVGHSAEEAAQLREQVRKLEVTLEAVVSKAATSHETSNN